ncbi:aminotransferase class I/II [Candidatus Peregrinibacteria bacterium CG_4_10_14_0_2_um_filter_43_11]|nr:MAG: aminotransferase class I/II [Candidatus Peregrinibacteria bacterium CG_4_10_14_0_2_um_filter_43_11]
MALEQYPSPKLSAHFESIKPSAIRIAGIEFAARQKRERATNQPVTEAIGTHIGNVSLPMHPAMQARVREIGQPGEAFADGVVRYTSTVGEEETQRAFLNVIAASGFDTTGLYVQVTDGGSDAMELMILGCCGPAGTSEKPLLMLDPGYTNYPSLGKRLGRGTVSVNRELQTDGEFALPDLSEIERVIEREKPGALVVIPYDNPTGQFMDQQTLEELARLCVKHNLWLVSDEAYRELQYTGQPTSSVWGITEEAVPGITGRRMSIETGSKVWNGCGVHIGALVTDNARFHEQSVAEGTVTLCANAFSQHVFGALANESREALNAWFQRQRDYYAPMMTTLTRDLRTMLPGVIVSQPQASIYSVVDVRDIAKPGFNANDFVLWCAREGSAIIQTARGDVQMTLLVSTMPGFYSIKPGEANPGVTQMRIAYVETPEKMALVPELFTRLFKKYEVQRGDAK